MTDSTSALLARLRSPKTLYVAPLAALALYPVIRPYDLYPQTVLLLAFLLAIQAVSWNIISGYAGYVSLGHSVFLGIGGYTAGIVGIRTGLNPFLAAPLAGVVAVVAALAIGSIALRTRGHAFVIITIALLLATQVVVTNWISLTNGTSGITMELPFWSIDYQNLPFYYFFFFLMVGTVAVSAWIRRSKFGTGLVAIREDEGKAAAVGVNTTRYKVAAYGVSAFFIGTAGAVYAYFQTFLNPVGAFQILVSVMIVLSALVGGRGTLWGPVLGAFIVQITSELATVYGGGTQSRVLLFGLVLVLVVLFLPSGLLPTIEAWWRRRHPQEVAYTDQAGALGSGRLEVRTPEPATSASGADRALLEVRGASKRFGGIVAVDNVDLTIRRGTISALIGPNGSGKTTLFNLITGTMRPDSGQIWFEGRRIDRLKPWTRGQRGLGRTFQITRLFKSMTVLENVVAPLPDARWSTMLSGAVSGHEADRARELLGFVGLSGLADERAGSLSYGQQKLVELAQVLMMEPSLILLDEPAGGVNPSLVARISEMIKALNEQGISFLVVEHNIPMVLDLCDPITVFSRGRPIAEGPPGSIRNDPVVLDAYLGDDWSEHQDPSVAMSMRGQER
jgi:ABC-type branched-subunit amino acid transport system ATPase component/ABC-type branched-subunit amino acid transport system permease subunit